MGFVSFELTCGTISCGASVNFGVDLNQNGNIDAGTAAEKGCGMSMGSIAGTVNAADGTSTAYPGTLNTGTRWFKLRLLIDIQAGTMRVDSKSLYLVTGIVVNNPQWTRQISGVNAKFNWGSTNAQNPALWDGVMFTSCKESVKMPEFKFTSYPVVGTYFNNITLTLQPCEAGTFWVNSSFCQNCPVGTYSSSTGMSVCSRCTKGMYSANYGLTSCISCELGTFGIVEGSASCVPCSTGSYSNYTGATMCISCTVGTYANTASSSVCSACQPGTYASVNSSSGCSDCQIGEYTPATGSTVCSQCLSCTLTGYYTTGCGGTSPGTCTLCINT
jgi:hypothetical protein